MLRIKNLEKIIRLPGSSVQVKQIDPIDGWFPQQCYGFVCESLNYPDKEFYIEIDRETETHSNIGGLQYPIKGYELTGSPSRTYEGLIWITNLQRP